MDYIMLLLIAVVSLGGGLLLLVHARRYRKMKSESMLSVEAENGLEYIRTSGNFTLEAAAERVNNVDHVGAEINAMQTNSAKSLCNKLVEATVTGTLNPANPNAKPIKFEMRIKQNNDAQNPSE